MRRLTLIFLMAWSITYSYSQQPGSSNWFTIQLPVTIDSHWQWLNEYSYRTINESFNMYQLFLRMGARYNVNEKWYVALSYDFTLTRTSSEKMNHEYGRESRIWQELSYRSFLSSKFSLQHKLRIEERFVSANHTDAASSALRVRYRLAALQAITDKWSVQLSDEYMQQYTDQRWSFNQNRIYLNNLIQLQPALQLQAGYYFVIRPDHEIQHVFAIGLQKRLFLHGGRKNA